MKANGIIKENQETSINKYISILLHHVMLSKVQSQQNISSLIIQFNYTPIFYDIKSRYEA